MNTTMKLYTKLLRIFLKAGIIFGVITGLLFGVLTGWKVGVAYGILSGFFFWVGVSGILLIPSILKSRSCDCGRS